MRKIAIVAAAMLCGFGAVGNARAQNFDTGGALDMGQLGQSLTLSASMNAQAERDEARLKGKRHSASATAVVNGSTAFRVDPAARKRNLASFVAKMRATNPQQATALEKAFATDPFAVIGPALRRYGLRTDDVADAITAYLVTAWYGVRGRNDDPPVAPVRGVRAQIHRALLATPAFASASNAARQQIGEVALVQSMIADAMVTAGKKNPAQMPQVESAIKQGVMSSFRMDLSALKLTDKGLQP